MSVGRVGSGGVVPTINLSTAALNCRDSPPDPYRDPWISIRFATQGTARPACARCCTKTARQLEERIITGLPPAAPPILARDPAPMTLKIPDTFTHIPAGPFIYGPEITYERLELAPPARPRRCQSQRDPGGIGSVSCRRPPPHTHEGSSRNGARP